MSIPVLLEGIQSPQKEQREDAENKLLELCAADPPQIFIELTDIAMHKEMSVNVRQLSLLCLRKFITMYWSAGFSSFVGPPGVGEHGKEVVRRGLLNLLANEETENKVILTVTYCIVQICAVDFPDEWPGLLDYLNEIVLNRHSENAIELLTELVEDIITNEMFFENYAGAKIVNTCLLALNDQGLRIEAKSKILRLYNHCISQLSNSSDFISEEEINDWVVPHVKSMNEAVDQLLTQFELNVEPPVIQFKGDIFLTLNKLFDVNQKLLGTQGDLTFRCRMVLSVMNTNSECYMEALKAHDEAKIETIDSSCINTIQFLAFIPNEVLQNQISPQFVENLIMLSLLPDDRLELTDYNEFISKETGLSATYDVRDEIAQYVSSCSDSVYYNISDSVLRKCLQVSSNAAPVQEASLFIFQELCSNDLCMNITRYQDFLSLAVMLLDDESCPVFVKSRMILCLPKFFENNMEIIPNVKEQIQQFLSKTVSCTINTSEPILLASFIISFTYYTSFAELNSILNATSSISLQQSLLKSIETLYGSSEEDSLGLLLEATHEIIKCWHDSYDFITRQQVLNMLLKLSSSEPSNVRIVLESVRSIPYLLKDLASSDYARLCETCFPSFIDTMSTFLESHQTYSPLVILALEFLSVFLKTPPLEKTLPSSVISFVLPPLIRFIKECPDENIMESSLQAFVYLACNSDPRYWREFLPDICDLVFSSERSLYKSIDASSIMLLSLRIEEPKSNRYIKTIMNHMLNKVLDPNKFHPIDSFIIIFCEILILDLRHCLDYLFSSDMLIEGEPAKNSIHVLFVSFEENRSNNMLKEIALAISALYFSNDQRLIGCSFHDEVEDVERPFKEYIVKIFADELIRQTQLEDDGNADIVPEDYEEEYVDQLNEDVVLLTGRNIELPLKEILTQFFTNLKEQNDENLSQVLQNLSEEDRLYISDILSY